MYIVGDEIEFAFKYTSRPGGLVGKATIKKVDKGNAIPYYVILEDGSGLWICEDEILWKVEDEKV